MNHSREKTQPDEKTQSDEKTQPTANVALLAYIHPVSKTARRKKQHVELTARSKRDTT